MPQTAMESTRHKLAMAYLFCFSSRMAIRGFRSSLAWSATSLPRCQRARLEIRASAHRDVTVDGRKISIDAQEELTLRCGKSSITLRRDGKIVIKGIWQLVSRAEGTNRIQGGSVAIN